MSTRSSYLQTLEESTGEAFVQGWILTGWLTALISLSAKQFREALSKKHDVDCGLAMIVKQRAKANEIDKMDLVGSVQGCDAIIGASTPPLPPSHLPFLPPIPSLGLRYWILIPVDDMVDTAGTLCTAAGLLKDAGARRVFAFASHGVLSGPAVDRISKSALTELVVLDTVPLSEAAQVSSSTTLCLLDV